MTSNKNNYKIDIDMLKHKYGVIRDKDILFDEPSHVYTILTDPGVKYTSVTTWNHGHFEQFNADKIIASMMASTKWPQNKYYGKSVEEIKALWDKNRDVAAAMGTCMHYMIEMFMNICVDDGCCSGDSGDYVTLGDILDYYNRLCSKKKSKLTIHKAIEHPDLTNSDDVVNAGGITCEWQYFLNFAANHRDLIPYRTEWTVFDEDLKLSGSIDMLFRDINGDFHIYDWKRSRDIVKTNGWNKYSHIDCIDHLPDTNYWHYCLQLNTYKGILERKYNIKINDLYLVCLHPENKNNNYLKIKVVDLNNEITDLFEARKLKLLSSSK